LTQYDAANALISDVSYTRDRTGNLLTQTDAAGPTTYAYDALYRLASADYPGTKTMSCSATKMWATARRIPGAA
jgi:YD repeat-containing protein